MSKEIKEFQRLSINNKDIKGKESKKYKLVSCSNPSSIGNMYIGVISTLHLIYFKDVGNTFSFSSLASSLIQDIQEVQEFVEENKSKDKVIIQTLNTKYIFEEVLEGIWGIKGKVEIYE